MTSIVLHTGIKWTLLFALLHPSSKSMNSRCVVVIVHQVDCQNTSIAPSVVHAATPSAPIMSLDTTSSERGSLWTCVCTAESLVWLDERRPKRPALTWVHSRGPDPALAVTACDTGGEGASQTSTHADEKPANTSCGQKTHFSLPSTPYPRHHLLAHFVIHTYWLSLDCTTALLYAQYPFCHPRMALWTSWYWRRTDPCTA